MSGCYCPVFPPSLSDCEKHTSVLSRENIVHTAYPTLHIGNQQHHMVVLIHSLPHTLCSLLAYETNNLHRCSEQ